MGLGEEYSSQREQAPTDMKVSDGEVEMEIGEPLEAPPSRTPKGTARSLTSSVRGEEI